MENKEEGDEYEQEEHVQLQRMRVGYELSRNILLGDMSRSAHYLLDRLQEMSVPNECDIQVFKDELFYCRFCIGCLLAAYMTIISMKFCLTVQTMFVRYVILHDLGNKL